MREHQASHSDNFMTQNSVNNPFKGTNPNATATQSDRHKKAYKTDFPSYHPLKLCFLGKAMAGKRTSANYIAKKIGSEKVTIFDMNEVLREVLVYVDPSSKVEEIVDPKAKAGAKKPADSSQVDLFAGKDTKEYKEIGTKLLKIIHLTTGIETGIPAKDVDLI